MVKSRSKIKIHVVSHSQAFCGILSRTMVGRLPAGWFPRGLLARLRHRVKRRKKRQWPRSRATRLVREDHSERAFMQQAQQAMADEDDASCYDPFEFIREILPRHPPPLPEGVICLPAKARGSPRISLVLDLDETLVHSRASSSDDDIPYDMAFSIRMPGGTKHRVRVRKRPFLEAFLERVSRLFEIIVFTASERLYADRLLTILDPHRRWITHRVFRDSCVYFEETYIKDLRVLGRDLAHTVIIDNSPEAFGFQVENAIPIESWFDDSDDAELDALLPFLESIASANDVRPLLRRRFNLEELIYGSKQAA